MQGIAQQGKSNNSRKRRKENRGNRSCSYHVWFSCNVTVVLVYSIFGGASERLPEGVPRLHALISSFGLISVLVTFTLTFLIVTRIKVKSVIGYCFGDQFPGVMRCGHHCRYRPKGVFGKGVGNSKNASEMRQKCVLFYWEETNLPKCVKIASKMRQKCAEHLFQKSLGVHNVFSAKFGFPPPPEKDPKWGKTVQISIKSSKVTLFPGGGTQFYGQNNFMDIWAFRTFGRYRHWFWASTLLTTSSSKNRRSLSIQFASNSLRPLLWLRLSPTAITIEKAAGRISMTLGIFWGHFCIKPFFFNLWH